MVLAGTVAEEIKQSSGKKRGPDAALSKTFRKLVQLAEEERRSGAWGVGRGGLGCGPLPAPVLLAVVGTREAGQGCHVQCLLGVVKASTLPA